MGGWDRLWWGVLFGIAVGSASYLFLERAVAAGGTEGFDQRLLLALRNPADPNDPIGPRWLEESARDLTALGGYVVLVLVTGIVATYLGLVQKHHAAHLLLLASIGGVIVMHLLKALVNRPRPDLVSHLAHESSASFPSGHAMLSAVVYLTLGAMLTRLVERRRVRVFVMSVAVTLSLAIGASRVYLGVHYPTDVLAGWLAGLVWAGLCWMLTRYLQGRGAVEPGSSDSEIVTVNPGAQAFAAGEPQSH